MALFYITDRFIHELENAAKDWMRHSDRYNNNQAIERFEISDNESIKLLLQTMNEKLESLHRNFYTDDIVSLVGDGYYGPSDDDADRRDGIDRQFDTYNLPPDIIAQLYLRKAISIIVARQWSDRSSQLYDAISQAKNRMPHQQAEADYAVQMYAYNTYQYLKDQQGEHQAITECADLLHTLCRVEIPAAQHRRQCEYYDFQRESDIARDCAISEAKQRLLHNTRHILWDRKYCIHTNASASPLQDFRSYKTSVQQLLGYLIPPRLKIDLRTFARLFGNYYTKLGDIGNFDVSHYRVSPGRVNDMIPQAFALFLGYPTWNDYCRRTHAFEDRKDPPFSFINDDDSAADDILDEMLNGDLLRIDLKMEHDADQLLHPITTLYLKATDTDRQIFTVKAKDGYISGIEVGDTVTLCDIQFDKPLILSRDDTEYSLMGVDDAQIVVDDIEAGQSSTASDEDMTALLKSEFRSTLTAEMSPREVTSATAAKYLTARGFDLQRPTLARVFGVTADDGTALYTGNNGQQVTANHIGTLDEIASYLGYHSYADYVFWQRDHSRQRRHQMPLYAADLQQGDRYSVTYSPDRELIFTVIEGGRCEVEEISGSENILMGDTFTFRVFEVGMPIVMTSYCQEDCDYGGYKGGEILEYRKLHRSE